MEKKKTSKRSAEPVRVEDGPVTKVIGFRVTEDEAARFDAQCERAGLTKSALFRSTLVGLEGSTRELAKASAETVQARNAYRAAETQIRRAGNNMNQIAHALNRAALEGAIPERVAIASVVMLESIKREMKAQLGEPPKC